MAGSSRFQLGFYSMCWETVCIMLTPLTLVDRIRAIPRLSSCADDTDNGRHHITLTLAGGLLILVTPYTRHLPPLPLLPEIHGSARHSTSRLQCQHSDQQHRWKRKITSPCWLFRYL